MDWIETIIIAVVEGLTEFLPVSSTGHMIITQNLLGLTPESMSETDKAFVHAFTFIIQFGAILSVVCLYWKRFFQFDNTPAPAGSGVFGKLKHKFYFYWLLIVGGLPSCLCWVVCSCCFATSCSIRAMTQQESMRSGHSTSVCTSVYLSFPGCHVRWQPLSEE